MKIKDAVIAGLIGLVGFLIYNNIQQTKQIDVLEDSNLSLKLEKQTFDSVKNKLNQTVIIQEAAIVKTQGELRKLSDEKFQLTNKLDKKTKEVLYYQKQVGKTTIVEVEVPYVDSAVLEQFSDSIKQKCAEVINYYEANTVTVPRSVALDTLGVEYKNGLRFEGTVRKNDFKIDSMSIIDTQYTRLVQKKRNFLQFITFQPRPIEVQILHTSPYLKVNSLNTVYYKPRKAAKILGKAILIGTGVFLGTKLN